MILIATITLVSWLIGGVSHPVTIGAIGALITMLFVDELVSYEWKESNRKC
ncbi:hypothetical protein P7H62_14520 [Vagococcus carniphilus]|uniref:hypothetical protein n=1 Tax=Vagococcus carniphilus TaxID=218144 RepID=UPI00288E2CF1|nr:hypothetical protein [Vagococcus carniphilus]MDT2832294.1 hypothetical protein [Vagococcus carniphilus]MDT2840711.1 hypothetical protein [Vagococcus carniphilus]MDT2855677.1 hypothetical protein [Vagococcus carniphilus]